MSNIKLNHILLIEDDKDILEVLKDLLESEGYVISCAENGKVAMNFLSASNELPDLILVDLMMPLMNGFEFCQRIVEIDRLKSIPVIVMSADGHIEKKKEQLNVCEYLKKPLDLENVLETISKYCH